MFLAKTRFQRLLDSIDDPDDYAIVVPPKAHPTMFIMVKRSELQAGAQSYTSNAVNQLLTELGEFDYNDEQSQNMLAETGVKSVKKEE